MIFMSLSIEELNKYQTVLQYICNETKNNPCKNVILIDIGIRLGVKKTVLIRDVHTLCRTVNITLLKKQLEVYMKECSEKKSHLDVMVGNENVRSELDQLDDWLNRMEKDGEKYASENNLNKLLEIRNQVKGSCDIFYSSLLKKARNPEVVKKSKSFLSFFQ